MALILSLETTTKVCSVAVTRNGELLALKESNDEDFGHAEKLHVYIEEALKLAGVLMKELDAVAVAGGPGSYTGLRIGVSAAKGFCFGLEKPLIAIDPLKALALRYKTESSPDQGAIIPMIDARRDEVFMSVFDQDLKLIKPTAAEIIDVGFFDGFSETKIYLVGDGAPKFAELFVGNDRVKVVGNCLASAEYIGKLAEKNFNKGEFVDLVYYEPFYGKEFKTTVSKKLNKIRTNS